MGNIKEGIELGIEALQFWRKFKGRRVRVWPPELTIRICSESHKKWVISAEAQKPSWWENSRQKYEEERNSGSPRQPDPLVSFAVENLTGPDVPHLETIEQGKLFEGTITDIIRKPPGIYLTDIQYWMLAESEGNKVIKLDSSDEGMLLPLNQIARIDFVRPGPFRPQEKSSWSEVQDNK